MDILLFFRMAPPQAQGRRDPSEDDFTDDDEATPLNQEIYGGRYVATRSSCDRGTNDRCAPLREIRAGTNGFYKGQSSVPEVRRLPFAASFFISSK